ncbi:MAG: hypothetical protein ACM3SP_27025 [Chloroflexota bacterium]
MMKQITAMTNLVFLLLAMTMTVNIASAQTLTVVKPSNHIVSPPLTQIHGGQTDAVHGPTVFHRPATPLPGHGAQPLDTALQTTTSTSLSASPGTNFDGMSVYDGGYIPSDSNIAVGPNHIVETVNAAYAIYDKNGHRLLGPNSLRSLWAGLGGPCAANNGGDPVVQYDRAADRWMITQIGSLSSPYAQCIAVSRTNDPTGAYNLYSYSFGSYLNDYPKFSVWPTATNSAYLATYNLFANGRTWSGAEICAYDRTAMINGAASPVGLCYTGVNGASFLPVDLDGATAPLDGTPAYFVDLETTNSLGMYAMSPNFATSTATLSSFSTLSVASFSEACGGGACVPQPGTTRQLDSLADRLMNRAALRVFSDHQSIVLNHSIAAGSSSAVRWYELQSPLSTNGAFSVYQQGTFAPDTDHRWMGSAALDQAGNIALGYSVSSATTFPSIRYTGRSPSDALGTMSAEASIIEGGGSQTGYTRWGDYTSMRIDPSDDCTFWYVNEYYPVTSSYGWYTRIGSFKFSGCGAPATADFGISASPTSLTLKPGNQGTSTITITSLNDFSDTVGLAVTGCPANTTCTFSSQSVTPPTGGSLSSTLTVTTTASTAPGTYTLTVTGTDALTNTMHVTTVILNVPVDFSISLSASSLTIKRGKSGTVTVSLAPVGGSSSVSLSIAGLPPRTSASFSPNPVTTSGTSTLKITVNRPASAGTYNLTITGNNGNYSHSKSLSLIIN